MIEVRNLKKYFNVNSGVLHAVDGVTFDIPKSKTLGVVGESGCGKSTLGRTLIRLLDSSSGQIIYNNEDITKYRGKKLMNLRKSMQIIFQDPYASLDPRMSVEQLIAEPIKTHKMAENKEALCSRVKELMDTVGLAQRIGSSYPHELDGGRRQRIGIARALALDPEFIVCDEPVSALDVSIQAQVLNLLQDLQKEKNLTYMFITHDMSVVKHISDEICVMYLGQIVEKCSAKELFEKPMHPYSQALLSAIPVPNIHVNKEKITIKGELSSPIDPKPCCRFAPRCMYAKEECFNLEPELLEVEPEHFVLCRLNRRKNGEKPVKQGIWEE